MSEFYYITPTNGKIRQAAVIAKSLGIKVVDLDRNSLNAKYGRAYLYGEEKYIAIAEDLPIEEKRLTLTHELSHFFLGHLLNQDEQFKVSYAQQEFEAETLGLILYNFLYGIDGGRE